jgi:hypothetical protein
MKQLHRRGQLTKLLPPVTQIIHSDNIPTTTLVKIGKETSYDSASQVTSVEGLRNIRTRKLHNNLLAFAGIYRTVLILPGKNIRDDYLWDDVVFEEESKEAAKRRGLLNVRILWKLPVVSIYSKDHNVQKFPRPFLPIL